MLVAHVNHFSLRQVSISGRQSCSRPLFANGDIPDFVSCSRQNTINPSPLRPLPTLAARIFCRDTQTKRQNGVRQLADIYFFICCETTLTQLFSVSDKTGKPRDNVLQISATDPTKSDQKCLLKNNEHVDSCRHSVRSIRPMASRVQPSRPLGDEEEKKQCRSFVCQSVRATYLSLHPP